MPLSSSGLDTMANDAAKKQVRGWQTTSLNSSDTAPPQGQGIVLGDVANSFSEVQSPSTKMEGGNHTT